MCVIDDVFKQRNIIMEEFELITFEFNECPQ